MGNPILGQGFGEPQPRIGPLAGQINHPSCCPGDNKNLPILRLFQGMEGLHPSISTLYWIAGNLWMMALMLHGKVTAPSSLVQRPSCRSMSAPAMNTPVIP